MNWLVRIVNTDKAKLKKVFVIALILIAGLEILTVNILHLGHGHFWFEDLPAFGSGYGFISCLIIIILAKFVLAPMVGKKEDYYE